MDWTKGFQFIPSDRDGLWLEERVEDLRQEKTVTSPQRTQEEIDKLTLDEHLSPIDRSIVLVKGQPLQQACALSSLPELFKKHQKDCLYRVLPLICDMLPTAPEVVQCHAAASFETILRSDSIQPHHLVSSLLPTLLKQIQSKEEDVSNLWLEAGMTAINNLPRDVVRREFLPLVKTMSKMALEVHARTAACQFLGALADKFEPFWTRKELWPLVHSLSQDVDHGVRREITRQLAILARTFGQEQTKSCILPEITQLLEDEEYSVRKQAMETYVDVFQFLDLQTLKSEILPKFKSICHTTFDKKDQMLPVVSHILGKGVHLLQDVLSSEERLWCLEFYNKLCTMDSTSSTSDDSTISLTMELSSFDIDSRRWCAFNSPCMVLFSGKEHYTEYIYPCICGLASDPSPLVRRQLCFGFHEIVNTIQSHPQRVGLKLATIYQQLLRDTHEEVIEGLLEHLEITLNYFGCIAKLSPDTKQPGLSDFIGPLLSCEKLLSAATQWRYHEMLLEKMAVLHKVLTDDQIKNKFVPLMLRYLSGHAALPVKMAAATTLLKYLRNMRKLEYREHICFRIATDCGKAKSYKTRVLFLDICNNIHETFSRCFFKQYFLDTLLQLVSDPIVNIRTKCYAMLPKMKQSLKLPQDHTLLQRLESAVRLAISKEMDVEASISLRETVAQLDDIKVSLDTYSRHTFFESDIIDQQKETEEKELWAELPSNQPTAKPSQLSLRRLESEDKLRSASMPRLHQIDKASSKKLSTKASPTLKKKGSHGNMATPGGSPQSLKSMQTKSSPTSNRGTSPLLSTKSTATNGLSISGEGSPHYVQRTSSGTNLSSKASRTPTKTIVTKSQRVSAGQKLSSSRSKDCVHLSVVPKGKPPQLSRQHKT